MSLFRRPTPSEEAERLLTTLSERWRGGVSLEYRSEASLHHEGEFKVTVQIHARLRRPNLARLTFRTKDWPEANRLRVCDGRRLFDRQYGPRGRTVLAAYRGRLTENIPHPLDEIGYTIDQFFSPTPFINDAAWGSYGAPVERVGEKVAAPEGFKGDAYRITTTQGTSKDTLYLDPVTYAPLLLIRVAEHAGRVQELLRETFRDVKLGSLRVSPTLFTWTDADERGIEEKE